jgi:NADH-quinone oxidoreductase subunit C/D
MNPDALASELHARCGAAVVPQSTADGVCTLWVPREHLPALLAYLKNDARPDYPMLYDLTAIDERLRRHRPEGAPPGDFTVVYHLFSFAANADLRLKVPLSGDKPVLPSITALWPAANWYEREVWDMFGIGFEGHPCLRRLLMPPTWQGHPLRKDHYARATETAPFSLTDERQDAEQDALQFKPAEWGLAESGAEGDYLFLNLGPQHPGTHGLLRVILQLAGEEIRAAVMDIGYHHRGAEKMAERQTWHTFIPYTDRIDYLGGAMNNLPYLLALERLAGITVPPRAQAIRVMLAELFRISSHLVWFGTFVQDIGALSPVFYMFNDRERILALVAAITGGRMHPGWLRLGGTALDLPARWDEQVDEFVRYFPARLDEYSRMLLDNAIVKGRTVGVGAYTTSEAIAWGVTGPGLRACGFDWDWRKRKPYSGYEQYDFEVPLASHGDCYDRSQVRVEEMRQSLRIIDQCRRNMPAGPYKAEHPLAFPPPRPPMLTDIETLIHHFTGSAWGRTLPVGESFCAVEATKGSTGYTVISDGGLGAYRLRIRTPSFPHLQMVPEISRGHMVADLLAILGSIDFVLADVDR